MGMMPTGGKNAHAKESDEANLRGECRNSHQAKKSQEGCDHRQKEEKARVLKHSPAFA